MRLFWSIKALPSALTTAWRVLKDMLPTRANLERRGLILESNRCAMCGEDEESGSHVFFECRVAWRVWCLCSEWVGEPTVVHREGKSHFLQFNLNWATQEINRFWRCVWIAVVREIWKQRNQVIFKEGRADISEIFTLAQLKAWTWLTNKENLAEFTYAHWCINPTECLKSIRKRR